MFATTSIFSYDTLRNIADISIVAYLIYRGLLVVKGTRAAPMLGGLTVVVLVYFLATYFGLLTLAWILSSFLSSIILVVVVVFQDEIRRGLTKVGLQRFFRKSSKVMVEKTIEDIVLTVGRLSRAKLGALIAVQREVGLDDLVEESVLIDAILNRKLLLSIFIKDSPLHDGAVVIENDRIKAAGCVLPLSFNPDLDPNLGTRHRAALGLSERSDAIVLVVSEESGAISMAREGRLIRNLDGSMLRDTLHRFFSTENSPESIEVEI